MSTGIAKPTPADAPDALMMNVLTPISRPAESSSGPPELPAQRVVSLGVRTHSARASAEITRTKGWGSYSDQEDGQPG